MFIEMLQCGHVFTAKTIYTLNFILLCFLFFYSSFILFDVFCLFVSLFYGVQFYPFLRFFVCLLVCFTVFSFILFYVFCLFVSLFYGVQFYPFLRFDWAQNTNDLTYLRIDFFNGVPPSLY